MGNIFTHTKLEPKVIFATFDQPRLFLPVAQFHWKKSHQKKQQASIAIPSAVSESYGPVLRWRIQFFPKKIGPGEVVLASLNVTDERHHDGNRYTQDHQEWNGSQVADHFMERRKAWILSSGNVSWIRCFPSASRCFHLMLFHPWHLLVLLIYRFIQFCIDVESILSTAW